MHNNFTVDIYLCICHLIFFILCPVTFSVTSPVVTEARYGQGRLTSIQLQIEQSPYHLQCKLMFFIFI